MFSLNSRLEGLEASPTLALNELCGQLKEAGRPVYRLGFGQSPFPVPPRVVQALKDNAHQKSYLPVRGLPELRRAVARFNERRLGIECQGEDVLIGPGSKELMFLLQLVTDADLIVPSPAWVSYLPQAQLLGRQSFRVPTEAEHRYRMQPEVLNRVLEETRGRNRILVTNSPGNPTGAAYRDDELSALAEVCAAHQVLVLSDEIYGELHHKGEHQTLAKYYPEGTVISSGLSKWCGAGGWRLGTLSFPQSLRPLLDAVAVAGSETYSATAAPIQFAAVSAFEDHPELAEYVARSREILSGLGQWVAETLSKAGVRVVAPEGGFYLFPDFSSVSKAPTSGAFCQSLLQDTGVALLPGESFGRDTTELTTRLAYVDFDGEAALANGGPVDESWLRTHCPRVVEAVHAITAWLG